MVEIPTLPQVPTLETARLILRPPIAEDAQAHAELMADPLTARFITLDGRPQDASAAWRSFATIVGHWSLRGFGFFSILHKQTGAWIGRTGPWMPEGWPGLEVGWSCHPAHRGQGYITEAAVAAMAWTFETRRCDRIISLIRPDNGLSQAVARRLGEAVCGRTVLFGFETDIWMIERPAFQARWPAAGETIRRAWPTPHKPDNRL
jgi:RimJ/RimL family protein N-acetyltransferase